MLERRCARPGGAGTGAVSAWIGGRRKSNTTPDAVLADKGASVAVVLLTRPYGVRRNLLPLLAELAGLGEAP